MKVLLIRLSSLGDVILATAAVEALTEGLPGAEVHVLTKPAFREVFRNHPGVARLLPWAPAEGLRRLARLLRGEGYRWIVDLHGNLRTRALRPLVLGPRWVVYRKGALRRRLAVSARRPAWLEDVHVVDRYVAALAPLGVAPGRRLPRVYSDAEDGDNARSLLRSSGWDGRERLVGLAPGARWATKAWPAERWTELAREIVASGLGLPVLLGGAEDAELCQGIAARAGGQTLDLAGKTPLLVTAALLRECAALVTNDSAPLHLATAVGTPVVALFGPTVRGFGFYPLGPRDRVVEEAMACRPCSLHGDAGCPKGHHRCLEAIPAARVLKEVRALLAEDSSSVRPQEAERGGG